MSTFVVGDVHGCFAQFLRLLEALEIEQNSHERHRQQKYSYYKREDLNMTTNSSSDSSSAEELSLDEFVVMFKSSLL